MTDIMTIRWQRMKYLRPSVDSGKKGHFLVTSVLKNGRKIVSSATYGNSYDLGYWDGDRSDRSP